MQYEQPQKNSNSCFYEKVIQVIYVHMLDTHVGHIVVLIDCQHYYYSILVLNAAIVQHQGSSVVWCLA